MIIIYGIYISNIKGKYHVIFFILFLSFLLNKNNIMEGFREKKGRRVGRKDGWKKKRGKRKGGWKKKRMGGISSKKSSKSDKLKVMRKFLTKYSNPDNIPDYCEGDLKFKNDANYENCSKDDYLKCNVTQCLNFVNFMPWMIEGKGVSDKGN
tara:strand:+ start:118 stop:573 length:456 start_codon:yes stop_codon:yes gene_type:complete